MKVNKRKMFPYAKKPNVLKHERYPASGSRTKTKKDEAKSANRSQKKAVRQIAKLEIKNTLYGNDI